MEIKRIVSVILASALISICCVPVYASEDMTRSDWGYFWLENYCGVDTSQIKNTDYGSSFAYIAERYGTTTLDNSITAVQNQINNPSYDAFYDYVKTQTHNTYVTTNNLSHYIIQQGQRTVETTSKKLWDMSGSSFFNSLYNKFFNNNGYKEQYETVEGNGGSYTDPDSGYNVSVVGIGYCKWWRYSDSSSQSTSWQNAQGREYFTSGYNWLVGDVYGHKTDENPVPNYTSPTKYGTNEDYIAQISVQGAVLYLGSGNVNYSNPNKVEVSFFKDNSNKVGFTVYFKDGNSTFNSFTFGLDEIWNDNAIISDGSQQIGLPSQIGGYFDENGVWHPLYTDPFLNPDGLVINPDGTVTLPNGQEVPIYIDPNEVSPEGQNEILKYWSDTPSDLDPVGQEWKDLELEPDGDGGFKLSGLGEALTTLFEKLTEGLGDILSGLFDGIGDLFSSLAEIVGGLVELLSNIFSLEWVNDLDLSIIELPDFADLYDDLINAFGTQIGLGDLT